MPSIPERVRRFAEEPDGQMAEAPPPTRRIVTPSYLLLLSPSPSQSNVVGIRTTEAELDRVIDEVRSTARAAGYIRCAWFVGPSCRPENLAELLRRRGFSPSTPPPFEPEFTVMAVTTPPPPPPPGAEARLVRTLDEYVLGLEIAMKAFDEPAEVAAEWIASAPKSWPDIDGVRRFAHLAFVDGRAVGYAFTGVGDDGLLLGGSGVLADARGRGAYRALLAARWAHGVELGKRAMVIHAGEMSRPILEHCGFERVCTLTVLDDPTLRG